MSGSDNDSALELADRIKAAADGLQHKKNSIHDVDEIRLQILQLNRQLKKKLQAVKEKIG